MHEDSLMQLPTSFLNGENILLVEIRNILGIEEFVDSTLLGARAARIQSEPRTLEAVKKSVRDNNCLLLNKPLCQHLTNGDG